MFKIIKWFFALFSPYVNNFEKQVDKFFHKIKSTDNIATIKEKLLSLMKSNLIVVNVWMEKKFKGYKYLTKNVRLKMYKDIKAIEKKLEEHINLNSFDSSIIQAELSTKEHSLNNAFKEKLIYIYEIMTFLRPGKYYHYISTASFGKLLRDPNEKKLEGDCNQIVTLYIYLYSLKYPLEDLKIKLLAKHVCLHFNGIDIEATNGQFAKYKDFEHILPVTEIISTNLLDLTDFRESVQKLTPRILVKSSQLAYAISSLKPLVRKNLNIAYHNL